jgi:hypothetical protein
MCTGLPLVIPCNPVNWLNFFLSRTNETDLKITLKKWWNHFSNIRLSRRQCLLRLRLGPPGPLLLRDFDRAGLDRLLLLSRREGPVSPPP